MYSLFCTRRPCFDELPKGKYTTPSLCIPHCWAWSAAELLASCSKAGPSDTGSPHEIRTSAL